MDGNQTPNGTSDEPQQFQPGATIMPGAVIAGDAPAAPVQQAAPSVVATEQIAEQLAPAPVQAPAPLPLPVVAPEPPAITTQQEQTTGYLPAPEADPQFGAAAPAEPVSWTASEFIAHHKTPGWYGLLIGGAIIIAVLVWFFTKDIFSAVVVLLAVGVLAAYASRQPRELQYVVDEHGITIGQKQFAYGVFRSFSVIDDGAFSSIELMPLKRFSPPITIYYDPNDEDAIAGVISEYLPFEHRSRDVIDQLIHRIRF
jgi:hypothetical protein